MLSGDVKWGALHAAEVFALPSHAEGFPIAAIEAMACGVPVLISNKVNIWTEIQATGGAFVARDDLSGVTELLGGWLRLSSDERKSLRRKAYEGYIKQFAPSGILKRFVSELQALGVVESSGGEQSP